jgi:DNA polymerase
MDLREELELLRDLGYTHLDYEVVIANAADERVTPATRRAASVEPPANEARPATSDQRTSTRERSADSDQRTAELLDLGRIAAVCQKCRLAKTRTNVVYGIGDPTADLMFIGEAPGHDEDVKGEPFVGRAGQLLTDIIKAMSLTRAQVYITNVVKCRPPENRNPEPDELDECRPYIQRQVELIQPKVIVTLGKFALQSLTGKTYGIMAIRGHWLEYEGVKVMPTFHPAYLLRTPAAKKDVWGDMKKVMAELGLAPPK